jgi:hypothetical protein
MLTDARFDRLSIAKASSLSDWGFDLREAPSVLSQIVG